MTEPVVWIRRSYNGITFRVTCSFEIRGEEDALTGLTALLFNGDLAFIGNGTLHFETPEELHGFLRAQDQSPAHVSCGLHQVVLRILRIRDVGDF
jgi:hypothetical protein